MKEYSLSEQFALISLDGMDAIHDTVAKKVALVRDRYGRSPSKNDFQRKHEK